MPDSTVSNYRRIEVVCVYAVGVKKAILPVGVVGYAAAVGTSVVEAHSLVPGVPLQAASRRVDPNGAGLKVRPQRSVSPADRAIAVSERAGQPAHMNSNRAAVAHSNRGRDRWHGA